ncbi:MAG: hypothetical protein ABJQ70_15815 [Roseobacter sp.]
MGWNVAIELVLEHDFYAPHQVPVNVRPADVRAFSRAGLILRRQGERFFVLMEEDETEPPADVVIDLEVQTNNVVTVTQGGNWKQIPQISLPANLNRATLKEDQTSQSPQMPGRLCLARITADLIPNEKRDLVIHFSAMESHWAYHVMGPDNGNVMIEDTEGEVQFDPLGLVDLPDGSAAQVIRSRAPIAARARPDQRFSLSRPGSFGPQILIPVLPAPQPQFATVFGPNGTDTLIQSDIYVSIF